MKTKFKVPVLVVMGMLFILGGFVFLSSSVDVPGRVVDNAIESVTEETSIFTRPCIIHIRDGEVLSEECDHNVLFVTGQNMIRDLITDSGAAAGALPTNITLCNANATGGCEEPVAAQSATFTPIQCCGLLSQAGTVAKVTNQNGNWTATKTFTATKDNIMTNVTMIGNTTTNLSAMSFTLVTLQTNDQLTVNVTFSAN